MANEHSRIHAAGAEVLALVVDPESKNAGMAERWHLPFRIVSDPGGERFLRSLELWNADERDGLAVPAMLVIGPDGNEVFRIASRDFADRIHDEEALLALEKQGFPALDSGPDIWIPSVAAEHDRTAFSPEMYGTYFRGNQYAAVALGGRVKDPEALAEIKAHAAMANGFNKAWKIRRETAAR